MVAGGGTMASAPPPAIGGNGGCASANTPNLPGTTNVAATPQGTNEGGPTRTRANENRRSNKPIMEKRRRARINNCLNELKTLILDAMKKDPARHSKLEKADILEMTVKHLEALQRQQVAMAAASDPNVANKFRAGFTECAGEVGRFPGLEGPVKRRLLQHLANCLNSTSSMTSHSETVTGSSNAAVSAAAVADNPPLQVHILRAPTQNEPPAVHQTNHSNIILANTNVQGLQLVPTRLPNGDIALILPSSNAFRSPRTTTTAASSVTPSSSPSPGASSRSSDSSPLPVLVPIPNGTRHHANSPPIAIDRLSVNAATPPRQIAIVATQNPQRILIPQRTVRKNGPLTVSYECDGNSGERVIQRRIIIPNAYSKPEKVTTKSLDEVPVIGREIDPSSMMATIQARSEIVDAVDGFNGNRERSPTTEDDFYDRPRNQIVMTQEGRIIESEMSTGYASESIYGSDRETLLHIPEGDYYEEGDPTRSPSPRSTIDYVEDHGNCYADHFDRSYSPDMPKPLALVTRKKCEEYGNEERPWRPW